MSPIFFWSSCGYYNTIPVLIMHKVSDMHHYLLLGEHLYFIKQIKYGMTCINRTDMSCHILQFSESEFKGKQEQFSVCFLQQIQCLFLAAHQPSCANYKVVVQKKLYTRLGTSFIIIRLE